VTRSGDVVAALLLWVRSKFRAFLDARTSTLSSLTSAGSRSTLPCSIIASPGLFMPLGMFSSECRACIQHVSCSHQDR
jgi:hypothetical protein